MYAFMRRLSCGEHVFFRAGPLAKKWKDPWKWGCLGEIDGRTVTLIGYDNENMPEPKPEALKAMARAAIDEGFEALHLDRIGENPRTLVLTSSQEGKIIMSVKKEKLHDIAQIFKPDGSLNVLAGMTGLTHFLGQHAAGHIAISGGTVTITAKSDGSEDVQISFNRK